VEGKEEKVLVWPLYIADT